MIDIHNHILPTIDDGPNNEEEMLALIKQAVEQGISSIVATPHHLHYKYNNSFGDVERQVNELNNNDIIKRMNINVYVGQEVRITDQLIRDLDNGNVRGINYSRYILLELPSRNVPHFTQRILYEIQIRGYIPIIVHPERNKEIASDINILYKLINQGALSQITTSSLSGKMGKKLQKLSLQMIENQLIHFIASDAHNLNNRPFIANDLFNNKKLKKYTDELLKLYANNECIIKNVNISKQRPIEHKKTLINNLFGK